VLVKVVSKDEVLMLGVVYVVEAFQAVFCRNRVKLESTSERRDYEPDPRPVIVDELWSRREGQITQRPLLNTRIHDSPESHSLLYV
jgi:hypothetical protein